MNKLRLRLSALAVLTLTLTCASIAQAQSRVYVSANKGQDINFPCTPNPCRLIQLAVAAVAAGGEVVVLDSGDYQPFTVNKAVTIEAAPGVIAGITQATSGENAITIDAGFADVVVLRGLTLNGMGSGYSGVDFNTGQALHVENCIISGFSFAGIRFDGPGQLFVKDAFLRLSSSGIIVRTTTGIATASIDHCRLEGNSGSGLSADNNSRVTIRDSIAANNAVAGFSSIANASGATADLNIENCLATSNGSLGIAASGSGGGRARVSVSNSTVTNNPTGISAVISSTIHVANTTITRNTTGLLPDGGSLISFGDNKLFSNTSNGTFTSTVAKQ